MIELRQHNQTKGKSPMGTVWHRHMPELILPAWMNPVNERGPRVRFLPWSGSATTTPQDRIMEVQSGNLKHRKTTGGATAWQTAEIRQSEAESSRQRHHAPRVDGKLLVELSGLTQQRIAVCAVVKRLHMVFCKLPQMWHGLLRNSVSLWFDDLDLCAMGGVYF